MNHHDCNCEFLDPAEQASDAVADMTDAKVLDRAKDLCPKSLKTVMQTLRKDLEEAIYERIKYGQ